MSCIQRLRLSTSFLLAGLLAAALVLPVHAASSTSASFGDRWIVELTDAPTLEFGGTDLALQAQPGLVMPVFEATAPSVTGVERFDAQAPQVQAYAAFLEQRQADFITDAAALVGRKLVAEGAFQHVANGVVLNISAAEADQLRGLPQVRKIYREPMYRLQLGSGPRLIGARNLNQGVGSLPGVRGEGIVVGVIDSGINWNHRAFSADPADNGGYVIQNPKGAQLGLCSSASVPCNNKLIGVYDFTNDSTSGLDTDGHGTHVAAIAVANDWQPGQAGVAPRANLVSYRVCVEQDPDDPDAGTCQGGAIVQALDRVIIDGVDVVNFSIGGGPLDSWTSGTARQVLNIRDAGISFVTSGGNSGPDPESVGWPAEAPWILAVGSSTTETCAVSQIQVQNLGNRAVTYGSGPNLSGPELVDVLVRRSGAFDNNFLGCNPYPAGALSNSVVLVERGDCTFATKVQNAEAAGALAVLVFNNEEPGRLCMAGLESSGIPAAMLSRSNGLELNGLINSGAPQRVSFNREGLADQVSSFSSRGPSINARSLMKPNLLAPGQGIQAAYVPGTDDVAGLSGTSMASPHVAGAIALLRQLNPGLNAAMASSVLETTAEAAPVTVPGSTANIFDRGAGRIRVDLAARAGLFLPANRAEFLAANPSLGGDPGALNLPGMVNENCSPSCTFSRTVSAMQAGTWVVSSEGQPNISVSPGSFSLQPGESRQLSITVTPQANGSTALQHGSVVLTPSAGQLVTQRLPIGVRSSTGEQALPQLLNITTTTNQGRRSLNLGTITDLPEAVFPTSALVAPQRESFSLPQDPSNNNPFDGSAGTRTFLIDVPDGALALWAETTASSAPDIDLFVGRDSNGDGIAQAGEEQCRSITPDQFERCVIENPQAGTWWVVVQNWTASAAAQDSVTLELAVLSEAEDASLIAFGPGRHAEGPLSIDLFWDVPELKRDQRLLGVVGISSRSSQAADIGLVPVAVSREAVLDTPTTVLFAGETLSVAVPGSGRHDRLVVDVPPTATSLSVRIEGESGVSGTLRRVPFSALRDSAPQTPEPDGPALASGTNSAAGFNMVRSSGLEPGRYFVQLQNSAVTDRVVDVTVTLQENGATVPRFGLWNPEGSAANPREIAQGIEWQQAGAGFALWYSYEPNGLPVFFLGTTPLNPNSSIWVTEVNRYTIGDGGQIADLAGTIGITAISEEEMVFSWRLNGGHGSDIKINPNADSCPTVDGQPVSYTGTWFTPGEDQGGSSVVITGNAQGHIRYYYDARGVGRWVLATDGGGAPLAEELDVLEFRGFCPNCDPIGVTAEVVGSYFRTFSSPDQGTEQLEFVSRSPLNEVVSREVPIVKLSLPLSCP